MDKEEARKEWDRLMEVKPSPKDTVTDEARGKASELFAALYPAFEESDPVSAKMLLDHCDTVVTSMAMAYQTILNEERQDE